MRTKFIQMLLALCATLFVVSVALAADPGAPHPFTSESSDQRPGSILFYPAYSSSATAGNTTNTRINVTNTNADRGVSLHLFFVDGSTCAIADSYICLTQNQTASFLASDVDPGVDGYIMAVAVNKDGFAIAFDHLIGDEYIKLASGHQANLAAYAAGVATPGIPTGTVYGGGLINGFLQGIEFEVGDFTRLPKVLAVDNIPSRADGNDTLVIINRVNGNYATGLGTPGTIFGLMYDDAENVFSYSVAIPGCQFRSSYNNNFPRTTPRFEQIAPAGRSGWTKFWSASTIDLSSIGGSATEERAIIGAVINRNSNTTAANAFNGGHNLHVLTLQTEATIAIPVFPPNC